MKYSKNHIWEIIINIIVVLSVQIQSGLFAQPNEYSLDLVGRIWFPSQEWNSGDTTGGSDVWG
ncbi:MAG TPA: hypothetical protein EYO48_06570, partial [Candidatus Marinimicrobia bacterium]|nr:hypothetical protein [Candidatus Neomarinimicrobiota bacterium]